MKRILALSTLLSLPLALVLAAGCSARRSEPIAGPLVLASEELRQGEIAFDEHCTRCHPGGEKGLAPAINNKPLPGFLIKFQVRHGMGAMPAFSKEEIPPEELDALVRYLKVLRHNRPEASMTERAGR
jgi:mono/diheme cytochrome c family protein